MGFSRSVKTDQRLMRLMSFSVDGTGTAALGGSSKFSASLTDNGTGDYTVTFDVKYGRAPEAYCTPLTTGIHCEIFSISTSAVRVKTFAVADGTTATDADFHLLVVGSDAADAI